MQNNEKCKQGYHFVGNDQFSVGFLGSRRSKMSPTGFIEACSLGVQKAIFGGFVKKKFFFSQITHNSEHIKNSEKNF